MNTKIEITAIPEMGHYCKDCREIVQVRQVGRRYVYICKKCGTKNVAFGSLESLKSFYHIKESETESDKKVDEKKTTEPEKNDSSAPEAN